MTPQYILVDRYQRLGGILTSSALNMVTEGSCLPLYETTRRHIAEDRDLNFEYT
jgi:hypothetical protein